MNPIISFTGNYRWLSNFFECPVPYDGEEYPSAEHAYQAAKSLDPGVRQNILTASNPGKAKKLGQTVDLRPDWEELKLEVMEAVVRNKFSRNPFLATLLRGTEDAELIEGNHWGDFFWGQMSGVGDNHLGKILMKIRSELQDAQTVSSSE